MGVADTRGGSAGTRLHINRAMSTGTRKTTEAIALLEWRLLHFVAGTTNR